MIRIKKLRPVPAPIPQKFKGWELADAIFNKGWFIYLYQQEYRPITIGFLLPLLYPDDKGRVAQR